MLDSHPIFNVTGTLLILSVFVNIMLIWRIRERERWWKEELKRQWRRWGKREG